MKDANPSSRFNGLDPRLQLDSWGAEGEGEWMGGRKEGTQFHFYVSSSIDELLRGRLVARGATMAKTGSTHEICIRRSILRRTDNPADDNSEVESGLGFFSQASASGSGSASC